MHRHDKSSQLEPQLRRSLTRRAAPSGFTDGVMQRIRAEASRDPQAVRPARSLGLTGFRMSFPRAVAACACAAAVVLALAFPGWQSRRQAESVAMQAAERELAEVLQLAGVGWVRAQEAAFSPLQDKDND